MKNVNKPCCEMLKENCIGCDNSIEIDGDYCHALKGYQQGREDERKEWECAIAELLIKYAGDICLSLPEQIKEIQDKAYQQGRADREEEIVKMLLDIKLKAFLTIANTNDKSLDVAYEMLGDNLDKLLFRIKG